MKFKSFFEKKSPNNAGGGRENDNKVEDDDSDDLTCLDKGFDYLLSMKIWSLTMERVQALSAQRNANQVNTTRSVPARRAAVIAVAAVSKQVYTIDSDVDDVCSQYDGNC